jgi:hypothetical protein
VTLGRPHPLLPAADPARGQSGASDGQVARASYTVDTPAGRPVVRAQGQDGAAAPLPPPPPPPPPPGSSPAAFPGSREEGYNCGVATDNPPPGHPFLDGTWRFITGVPAAVNGVLHPGAGRACFQSDHAFDGFISPVTNPFFFEDPRALTEVRPIFIYQHVPNHTPIFGGADIEFFGLQARAALTERLSLVLSKLGWVWAEVHEPAPGFASHTGFAEVQLGPQYTIIRNEKSGTLLALGVNFDIPAGPHKVWQDTGNLSISPYLSFGQGFCLPIVGNLHFLNTTGYNFSTNNQRSEFFYSSFHLDWDVADWHRFYPLVELNWFSYTSGGHGPPLGFEGTDLFNFGATGVSGHNDLSIAVGARYKFTECVQFGAAAEFPLIGSHDLSNFRLTVDMIFRY